MGIRTDEMIIHLNLDFEDVLKTANVNSHGYIFTLESLKYAVQHYKESGQEILGTLFRKELDYPSPPLFEVAFRTTDLVVNNNNQNSELIIYCRPLKTPKGLKLIELLNLEYARSKMAVAMDCVVDEPKDCAVDESENQGEVLVVKKFKIVSVGIIDAEKKWL